jgi:PAS domain S-box-containing protein
VVVFANKTAQKNTGYTLGEMYGNTPRLWGGLMSADFYQNFWRKKHEVKGYEGQLTNRRKNGELYTVIVHISPITNKNGALVGYIGTEEDITQIVSLKNQLSQDKKRDEALLRSLGEGVVAQDENGKVTFVNKAGLDMLGYSLHELLGKSFVHIVRADSPKTENRLTELERPLFQARVTKQPVRAELIYYRKDGSIFESEVIITPVYTEEKYYGDIQVFKDITKEKEIDKAKTEFVSLASHQLRTPLTAIKWYSKMLLTEDRGKITEKQKEYLDEIHDGNEKMVSLVNTLLNVSRIELGTFVIAPQQVQVI